MGTLGTVDSYAEPSHVASLADQPEIRSEETSFIAVSPLMMEVRSRAALVAAVNVPILLLGETGTGKEVVARYIHDQSPRRHRMFFKVNCAAVPSELLESELFGYEAGAFTGANRSKPGYFEICKGGTLFLDEIGEMPILLQTKLLHVLQDKAFCRLGGRSTVGADVRILAATNVDITRAMREGRFRGDLYYRLSTFTIHLPPLRERREDVAILFRYFMNRFAAEHGLSPRPLARFLIDACLAYSWPGNVRELENFVRRYLTAPSSHNLHEAAVSNSCSVGFQVALYLADAAKTAAL